MNPAILLFTFSGPIKKYGLIVLGMLVVIIAMPMIAIFSFGKGALSFLADGGGSVSAVSLKVQGFYEGPEVPGDTYAWGNCTYWAFALRLQYGDPIPTTWGNANTWDDRAAKDGYLVDHTPSVGSIFQDDNAPGGLGHVAYVSAIDPLTGDWTISEMNAQGLNVVDTRTYKAGTAIFYNFIHDKTASKENNGLLNL